jgi:hypothetical protein
VQATGEQALAMRPSRGRARPRLAPIFCLVLASFAETSCGRGLSRRTNVAEMRGPPLVSLLPGDRMVLRGGGDGDGDEDMFDNGGGPMEPGEDDNVGVRSKLNDIMEATTEEDRGRFTAEAAAEIKRLGQKGAIQVGGEGERRRDDEEEGKIDRREGDEERERQRGRETLKTRA